MKKLKLSAETGQVQGMHLLQSGVSLEIIRDFLDSVVTR